MSGCLENYLVNRWNETTERSKVDTILAIISLFPNFLASALNFYKQLSIAMFLSHWCSYHQWYLRWCLAVLTGPPDPCYPIARPAVNSECRSFSEHVLCAQKKPFHVLCLLLFFVTLKLASQFGNNW